MSFLNCSQFWRQAFSLDLALPTQLGRLASKLSGILLSACLLFFPPWGYRSSQQCLIFTWALGISTQVLKLAWEAESSPQPLDGLPEPLLFFSHKYRLQVH